MTLTIEKARQLAEALLRESSPSVSIVDESTVECTEGWVFSYQSSQFLKTGALNDMLAGNCPIFVSRDEAWIGYISYKQSLSESMAAYRYCDNPNAVALPQIDIYDWEVGANTVSAIQAVRKHTTLGLAAAKNPIELALAKQRATVTTSDVEAAKELISTLAGNGFLAKLVYGPDRPTT